MAYRAIDLHTTHRQIRIVTAEGTVVLERGIVTRADQFAAVLGGRDRMRSLLESHTASERVATGLEALGHEAVVAYPNDAARAGTRTQPIKTDRRDVAPRAEANRTGIESPRRARIEGRETSLVTDAADGRPIRPAVDSGHRQPLHRGRD